MLRLTEHCLRLGNRWHYPRRDWEPLLKAETDSIGERRIDRHELPDTCRVVIDKDSDSDITDTGRLSQRQSNRNDSTDRLSARNSQNRKSWYSIMEPLSDIKESAIRVKSQVLYVEPVHLKGQAAFGGDYSGHSQITVPVNQGVKAVVRRVTALRRIQLKASWSSVFPIQRFSRQKSSRESGRSIHRGSI